MFFILSLSPQLIAQDSKLSAAGQHSTVARQTSWDVVRHTIQQHGVGRLWRGMGITMWRDGVGVAAFFCAKRAVERTLDDGRPPSFGTTVLAGGLAGLSYWVVSLPLDTMKTWIQSGDLSRPPVHVMQELRHTFQATTADSSSAALGGFGVAQRLLRGWQVAYSRGIPSAAITIAVYSVAYRTLEQQQQQ